MLEAYGNVWWFESCLSEGPNPMLGVSLKTILSAKASPSVAKIWMGGFSSLSLGEFVLLI